MQLDLSSLEKAIAQLEDSLRFSATPDAHENPAFNHLRAGSIQAFEYTYSLCFKFLRRILEMDHVEGNDIDHLTFRDLVRIAYEAGLILDVKAWFTFWDKRNITNHTYDEGKAAEVLDAIPKFIEHARYLLKQLRSQSAQST